MNFKITRAVSALLLCATLLSCVCSCSSFYDNGTEAPNEPWGDGANINDLDLVSTKTAPAPVIPDYSGADTFRVLSSDAIGQLSPFFAKNAAEHDVASLTNVKLLEQERGGRVVINGIDGESFEYNGSDYTYYTICDLDVKMNADSSAVFEFKLREDVFFSDGINLSADDVIFSMYVLLDPSYDGTSRLSSLPIKGLSSYRSGMVSLSSLITAGGRDGVSELYSKEQASFFYEKNDEASSAIAADIVKGINELYGEEMFYTSSFGGKWQNAIADSEQLQIAYALVIMGYAEWEEDETGEFSGELGLGDSVYDCINEFPTLLDLYECVVDECGGEDHIEDCEYSEYFEQSLVEYRKQAFADRYDEYYNILYSSSTSNKSISGIKKTGMYSFTVETEKYDATMLYAFCFYVMPLHKYADRDAYKYTAEIYGFTKGDLTDIKNKGNVGVGAGAYVFRSESDGVYKFSRNELYYLGCPYVKNTEIVYVGSDVNVASDIAQGKYDYALGELDLSLITSVKEENGKAENDILYLGNRQYDVYGYVGLNAERVKVGEDSSSEQSKALRTAFGVLFTLYREESVYYYFGERAQVAEHTLGAYSYVTINGETIPYIQNELGEHIYNEEMTDAQRYDAALALVREYLATAGYTYDEKTKKFTECPAGASLQYEIMILGAEQRDNPVYSAAESVSKALSKLGIELRITDAQSAEELSLKLKNGTADMWASARQISEDADMYQFYYAKNVPSNSSGTGSNYTRIADAELDRLISDGRKAEEYEKRIEIYQKGYGIVYDWAVEVPMYFRAGAYVYSASRVADGCGISDMTDHWGWAEQVYTFRMN